MYWLDLWQKKIQYNKMNTVGCRNLFSVCSVSKYLSTLVISIKISFELYKYTTLLIETEWLAATVAIIQCVDALIYHYLLYLDTAIYNIIQFNWFQLLWHVNISWHAIFDLVSIYCCISARYYRCLPAMLSWAIIPSLKWKIICASFLAL